MHTPETLVIEHLVRDRLRAATDARRAGVAPRRPAIRHLLRRSKMKKTRLRPARGALLALTAMAALTAAPAQAAGQPDADALGTQCASRDGTFATGYGYHRCFGAQLDGQAAFTAAANVCGRARGTDFRWAPTPDDYYGPGRGSWICAIA